MVMVKKNYKGRCIKRSLTKSKDVLKLYSKIQERCAVLLQEDEKITEIRCNVPLDGLSVGDYTSDFVCRKKNKDILVRECVRRCHLTKPMTVKLSSSPFTHRGSQTLGSDGGRRQERITTGLQGREIGKLVFL